MLAERLLFLTMCKQTYRRLKIHWLLAGRSWLPKIACRRLSLVCSHVMLISSCLAGSAALLFFIHETDDAEGKNGCPPAASSPTDRHLPLRTSL